MHIEDKVYDDLAEVINNVEQWRYWGDEGRSSCDWELEPFSATIVVDWRLNKCASWGEGCVERWEEFEITGFHVYDFICVLQDGTVVETDFDEKNIKL